MRVELSQAFEKMAGRPCIEISLQGPTPLRDVLGLLARECEAFTKYLLYRDDALLGAHLSVFSSGKFLKLDDPVDHGDTLKLFLPVTGG
ncbi:MAG: MoaD/ThiS family protein [Desulfarculaceae bacterium]|nr:MoaD/ThiS family protein [Desulfarculaceae bacterium]MCF8045965.1 MoaD/ThiS family protein [Desulfarculaceae bacterium]MCF8063694.1 MoaD/ThiS family protein [Desulfarculaceae bacterium]MCF8097599.1 MoaD/ThiS family protein [Desulfarculaceae bacterium]MCF8121168.1 MoaD/ThiS family protein [Desulfarculaceae bacterium]